MKIQPEWIEWKGGEMPVNRDALVAYQTRGGKDGSRTDVNEAWRLKWGHDGDYTDVIAYCKLEIEPYTPKPKWTIETNMYSTDFAALCYEGKAVANLRSPNRSTSEQRIADALNAAGVEL